MRKLGWIVLGASITALAACGSSPTAPPTGGPAVAGFGTFTLWKVNGQPLPTSVSSQHWYDGSLRLDSTGVYTRQTLDSAKNVTGGWDIVLSEDHGTWTTRGDSIFLTTQFAAFGYGNGAGVFTSTGATLRTANRLGQPTPLELEFLRGAAPARTVAVR